MAIAHYKQREAKSMQNQCGNFKESCPQKKPPEGGLIEFY